MTVAKSSETTASNKPSKTPRATKVKDPSKPILSDKPGRTPIAKVEARLAEVQETAAKRGKLRAPAGSITVTFAKAKGAKLFELSAGKFEDGAKAVRDGLKVVVTGVEPMAVRMLADRAGGVLMGNEKLAAASEPSKPSKKTGKPASPKAKAAPRELSETRAARREFVAAHMPALDKAATLPLRVTVLVKENPKSGKSAKRFSAYKTGMTVTAALEAGVLWPDIRWDVGHEFIKLGK